MFKIFTLALERFTNPFYMVVLTFLIWGSRKLEFLQYSERENFVNTWGLVSTAAFVLYVYFLGPSETIMKRFANFFVLFVSLVVATAFKWIEYLPLISGDLIISESARSAAYVVNTTIGIIIGQALLFVCALAIKRLTKGKNNKKILNE